MTNNILKGSLWKGIMRFSVSLALTGMLQQLFNAADVAVVGRFVGKNAMAAVGSNTPIIGLLVNVFVGISLGANVVIARFTGMDDKAKIRKAVDSSLIIALVCGVFAAVAGEIFAVPILKMMRVPPEVFDMSLAYLRIYLAGVPVILLFNFESAIFRSQGDSQTPLICLAISGVINVILNLFFVIVFRMTAGGVALSTVISNLVSSAVLFYILTHSDRSISIHRHTPELDLSVLKSIFFIGFPAGIQSAVFSISNLCIQSAINLLGADIMAASSAALNIEIFAYYIVNAFGQAATTFIGQNYGAGNIPRCKEAMKKCFILDTAFTLAVTALILIFGKSLLAVFNSDATVIGLGYTRLFFIVTAEAVNAVIEVFSGTMRGYGKSLVPAMVSLCGICGVRILWVYTAFSRNKSFNVLLLSYPISWCVTALGLTAAYFLLIKKDLR